MSADNGHRKSLIGSSLLFDSIYFAHFIMNHFTYRASSMIQYQVCDNIFKEK